METGAPVCLGRCESAPALRKGAGDPDRPLGLPCEALVVAHLELEPQVGLQRLPPWAPFSGPRAVPPQSWCLVGDCCQLLGQREWRRCLTAKLASLPLDVGPTVGGAWWQQPLAPSSPQLLALQHPSAHIASWRNIPRAHVRGALTTPEASEGYPLPGSSSTTPLCVLSLSHPSIHAPCFPTSVPLHILRPPPPPTTKVLPYLPYLNTEVGRHLRYEPFMILPAGDNLSHHQVPGTSSMPPCGTNHSVSHYIII